MENCWLYSQFHVSSHLEFLRRVLSLHRMQCRVLQIVHWNTAYMFLPFPALQSWHLPAFPSSLHFGVGVPWRDMADDGTVDEGRDNFYYVLNNVIKGNHLPCPNAVIPLLPELPEVLHHD